MLDAERRRALEEALADARNKASGAARAIPSLEAVCHTHQSRANAIGHQVAAAVSAIIAEEAEPGYREVIQMKAQVAERLAKCESGREQALRLLESIPYETRQASRDPLGGSFEKVRQMAHAAPAPSVENTAVVWAAFARALAADATASVWEG